MAQMANQGLAIFQEELKAAGVHASETAWIGTDFDAVLENNQSMDYLYAQINNLVQDLQPAMVDQNDAPLQHNSSR